MNKKTIIAIAILVVLYAVAGTAHSALLGNAKPVSLPQAPPFAGVISQALGENGQGTLPVDNVDYRLSTHNFDSNTWIVADITPLNQTFEPSTVVLKNVNGIYQVVVNPTNALPAGELAGLPNDVATYLRSQVAVYQQVPGE